MTEPQQWQTHEPPWLAKLHPDLVEDEQTGQDGSLDPQQRAARLVAELERAASGRVPPALAGDGWRETEAAVYNDQASEPQLRARTAGPYPCQLPEQIACPGCDRELRTDVALKVHQAATCPARRPVRPTKPERPGHTTTATKPKPGAGKKKKRKDHQRGKK